MGHDLRAKVQADRVRKKMEELKGTEGHSCAAYIDFKMNFLPNRFRESSNQWFGNRGIRWHGAVKFYESGSNESDEDARIEEGVERAKKSRKGRWDQGGTTSSSSLAKAKRDN